MEPAALVAAGSLMSTSPDTTSRQVGCEVNGLAVLPQVGRKVLLLTHC